MLTYQIPEIQLRLFINEPDDYHPMPVNNPLMLEKYLEPLKHSPNEQLVALHLNTNGEITGICVVAQGSISESTVHPREIFKAAIINNAHSIILAHNHPSGNNQPSKADIQVTQGLIAAGELLGIPVIDHVIVSPTNKPIYSLREQHDQLWD